MLIHIWSVSVKWAFKFCLFILKLFEFTINNINTVFYSLRFFLIFRKLNKVNKNQQLDKSKCSLFLSTGALEEKSPKETL